MGKLCGRYRDAISRNYREGKPQHDECNCVDWSAIKVGDTGGVFESRAVESTINGGRSRDYANPVTAAAWKQRRGPLSRF